MPSFELARETVLELLRPRIPYGQERSAIGPEYTESRLHAHGMRDDICNAAKLFELSAPCDAFEIYADLGCTHAQYYERQLRQLVLQAILGRAHQDPDLPY